MTLKRMRGMGVAIITPFTETNEVDYAALERLVDLHLNSGTDFLCVQGTTGETPTLSIEEKRNIRKRIIKQVDGRMGIMLGCGGNNTRAVIEELQNEDLTGVDGILSVDTTKGNRIFNHRGFAISPTVKQGYILRTSEDLLDIMSTTTGELPKVFALTTQDITPYGNDLYHLNSILQPATATDAPVVGVAITAQTMVAGCASGASHFTDCEEAARFMLEVAKRFGAGTCQLYDKEEWEKIQEKYGSMAHLQKLHK